MFTSAYYFSYLDVFPYAMLLILVLFLTLQQNKVKNAAFYIFLILFVFSAIRYDVGWDFLQYEKLVNEGEKSSDRFEWLSRILFVGFNKVGYTQSFFIFCSFCTLYPIYVISKKYSSDSSLSLFLFFVIPLFYLPSFGMIRNSLAFSIVFYSYDFLYRKKYLSYFICIILASGMHGSAYMGLLMFFARFWTPKLNINILAFILSMFLSDVVKHYIGNGVFENDVLLRAQAYTNTFGSPQGATMKYFVILFAILNFMFWNKISAKNSSYNFLLRLANIGNILFFLFSFEGSMSLRFSSYFLIFNILLIPLYLSQYNNTSKLVLFKSSVLMFGSALYGFYLYLYIQGFLNGELVKISYIPYKIFFLQ